MTSFGASSASTLAEDENFDVNVGEASRTVCLLIVACLLAARCRNIAIARIVNARTKNYPAQLHIHLVVFDCIFNYLVPYSFLERAITSLMTLSSREGADFNANVGEACSMCLVIVACLLAARYSNVAIARFFRILLPKTHLLKLICR